MYSHERAKLLKKKYFQNKKELEQEKINKRNQLDEIILMRKEDKLMKIYLKKLQLINQNSTETKRIDGKNTYYRSKSKIVREHLRKINADKNLMSNIKDYSKIFADLFEVYNEVNTDKILSRQSSENSYYLLYNDNNTVGEVSTFSPPVSPNPRNQSINLIATESMKSNLSEALTTSKSPRAANIPPAQSSSSMLKPLQFLSPLTSPHGYKGHQASSNRESNEIKMGGRKRIIAEVDSWINKKSELISGRMDKESMDMIELLKLSNRNALGSLAGNIDTPMENERSSIVQNFIGSMIPENALGKHNLSGGAISNKFTRNHTKSINKKTHAKMSLRDEKLYSQGRIEDELKDEGYEFMFYMKNNERKQYLEKMRVKSTQEENQWRELEEVKVK